MQSSIGILPMRNGHRKFTGLDQGPQPEFRWKFRCGSKAQTLNHDTALTQKDHLYLHLNSRNLEIPSDQKTINTYYVKTFISTQGSSSFASFPHRA